MTGPSDVDEPQRIKLTGSEELSAPNGEHTPTHSSEESSTPNGDDAARQDFEEQSTRDGNYVAPPVSNERSNLDGKQDSSPVVKDGDNSVLPTDSTGGGKATAESSPPESDRQHMKAAAVGVRICQALLAAIGVGWTLFITPGHLDDTQIPGFLISMAISWWLTPEIKARAVKLKLVDRPGDERRIHKVAVPRLGGVAIYISVIATIVLLAALTGRFPRDARGAEGGLVGMAVGGTLVFVLGLMDDLGSLPAKLKLAVQVLAGCAAFSLGVRIKSIPIPLSTNLDFLFIHIHGGAPIELGWLSGPLTVFWLVGIANAVNLIDGMDGLAAGVSAISSLTIWSVALAHSIDRPYAALAAAVLAGALLGFLRWNFNPARIFLGDSGAYLTGFLLAAISITGVIKGAAAATVIVPTCLLVVLILFFPILDTTWAIVRRTLAGKKIFEPDAQHIHHVLLRANEMNQKKVAYLIYGASALLGLVAVFIVHQQSYFIKLSIAVLSMALFFAEVLNRHRQRGAAPTADPDEVTLPPESNNG